MYFHTLQHVVCGEILRNEQVVTLNVTELQTCRWFPPNLSQSEGCRFLEGDGHVMSFYSVLSLVPYTRKAVA